MVAGSILTGGCAPACNLAMPTPEIHGRRKSAPVGFEPTRGDLIDLAGRRLNRSAKVSLSAECASPAQLPSVANQPVLSSFRRALPRAAPALAGP
eukprot:8654742-Pyramimonas_sp.AAC.1